MSAAFRSIAIGYAVFLVIASPAYLSPAWNVPPSEIIGFFPYIAAVVAGLVLAHLTSSHETRNALVLGSLISLSLGLLNLLAPYVGLGSDLPGLYHSVWIVLLSLPVTLFLVFAGTGLKGLWGKIAHDT